MRTNLLRSVALGTVVAIMAITSPAWAGIVLVDQFRNDAYIQTRDGNSLAFNGTFFGARLTSDNPNDYDSVQLSHPGPDSPVTLTVNPSAPNLYEYVSAFLLPDRATLDAAFPFGTYEYTATNASGTDTASYDYTSDAYALTLPYLTGTNYSDLQGFNAGTAFNFQFSPFTPDPAATNAFQFLTIFDTTTGAVVYTFGFLSPSTTSVTLPAQTLEAGHSYAYELIFSDRVTVPSSGSTFDGQIGFDVRTSGLFTTAVVPEPSTLLMTIIGGGLFGFARLRRSRTVPGASTA